MPLFVFLFPLAAIALVVSFLPFPPASVALAVLFFPSVVDLFRPAFVAFVVLFLPASLAVAVLHLALDIASYTIQVTKTLPIGASARKEECGFLKQLEQYLESMFRKPR